MPCLLEITKNICMNCKRLLICYPEPVLLDQAIYIWVFGRFLRFEGSHGCLRGVTVAGWFRERHLHPSHDRLSELSNYAFPDQWWARTVLYMSLKSWHIFCCEWLQICGRTNWISLRFSALWQFSVHIASVLDILFLGLGMDFKWKIYFWMGFLS